MKALLLLKNLKRRKRSYSIYNLLIYSVKQKSSQNPHCKQILRASHEDKDNTLSSSLYHEGKR